MLNKCSGSAVNLYMLFESLVTHVCLFDNRHWEIYLSSHIAQGLPGRFVTFSLGENSTYSFTVDPSAGARPFGKKIRRKKTERERD
jgi:hypothetical protein